MQKTVGGRESRLPNGRSLLGFWGARHLHSPRAWDSINGWQESGRTVGSAQAWIGRRMPPILMPLRRLLALRWEKAFGPICSP